MPNTIYYDLEGNIIAGSSASGTLTSPGHTLKAYTGAQGALEYSGYAITSDGTATALIDAQLEAPGHSITGSGVLEAYATAALIAPGFDTLWGVAELEKGAFSLSAVLSPAVSTDYISYATNISNNALTKYTNFQFNSIVRFRGKSYGCGENGIYLLDGSDDDGSNIDAFVELAPTDFDSPKQKRLPYVYVACRHEDQQSIVVAAKPDEGAYRSNSSTTIGRKKRVQLPRGLKAYYWTVKVQNQLGKELDIDEIEYRAEELDRRLWR